MRYRRFTIVWAIACTLFLAASAHAQTKGSTKSITVYQDPG